MAGNKSQYAIDPCHSRNKFGQQYEHANHSFKPLVVNIAGLSRVASARLLLRRAHRPITMTEALCLDSNKISETSSSQQNIVTVLSQHPIIEKTKGHPCEILRLALMITKDLSDINMLISQITE